jgi:hypothetical protein
MGSGLFQILLGKKELNISFHSVIINDYFGWLNQFFFILGLVNLIELKDLLIFKNLEGFFNFFLKLTFLYFYFIKFMFQFLAIKELTSTF